MEIEEQRPTLGISRSSTQPLPLLIFDLRVAPSAGGAFAHWLPVYKKERRAADDLLVGGNGGKRGRHGNRLSLVVRPGLDTLLAAAQGLRHAQRVRIGYVSDEWDTARAFLHHQLSTPGQNHRLRHSQCFTASRGEAIILSARLRKTALIVTSAPESFKLCENVLAVPKFRAFERGGVRVTHPQSDNGLDIPIAVLTALDKDSRTPVATAIMTARAAASAFERRSQPGAGASYNLRPARSPRAVARPSPPHAQGRSTAGAAAAAAAPPRGTPTSGATRPGKAGRRKSGSKKKKKRGKGAKRARRQKEQAQPEGRQPYHRQRRKGKERKGRRRPPHYPLQRETNDADVRGWLCQVIKVKEGQAGTVARLRRNPVADQTMQELDISATADQTKGMLRLGTLLTAVLNVRADAGGATPTTTVSQLLERLGTTDDAEAWTADTVLRHLGHNTLALKLQWPDTAAEHQRDPYRRRRLDESVTQILELILPSSVLRSQEAHAAIGILVPVWLDACAGAEERRLRHHRASSTQRRAGHGQETKTLVAGCTIGYRIARAPSRDNQNEHHPPPVLQLRRCHAIDTARNRHEGPQITTEAVLRRIICSSLRNLNENVEPAVLVFAESEEGNAAYSLLYGLLVSLEADLLAPPATRNQDGADGGSPFPPACDSAVERSWSCKGPWEEVPLVVEAVLYVARRNTRNPEKTEFAVKWKGWQAKSKQGPPWRMTRLQLENLYPFLHGPLLRMIVAKARGWEKDFGPIIVADTPMTGHSGRITKILAHERVNTRNTSFRYLVERARETPEGLKTFEEWVSWPDVTYFADKTLVAAYCDARKPGGSALHELGKLEEVGDDAPISLSAALRVEFINIRGRCGGTRRPEELCADMAELAAWAETRGVQVVGCSETALSFSRPRVDAQRKVVESVNMYLAERKIPYTILPDAVPFSQEQPHSMRGASSDEYGHDAPRSSPQHGGAFWLVHSSLAGSVHIHGLRTTPTTAQCGGRVAAIRIRWLHAACEDQPPGFKRTCVLAAVYGPPQSSFEQEERQAIAGAIRRELLYVAAQAKGEDTLFGVGGDFNEFPSAADSLSGRAPPSNDILGFLCSGTAGGKPGLGLTDLRIAGCERPGSTVTFARPRADGCGFAGTRCDAIYVNAPLCKTLTRKGATAARDVLSGKFTDHSVLSFRLPPIEEPVWNDTPSRAGDARNKVLKTIEQHLASANLVEWMVEDVMRYQLHMAAPLRALSEHACERDTRPGSTQSTPGVLPADDFVRPLQADSAELTFLTELQERHGQPHDAESDFVNAAGETLRTKGERDGYAASVCAAVSNATLQFLARRATALGAGRAGGSSDSDESAPTRSQLMGRAISQLNIALRATLLESCEHAVPERAKRQPRHVTARKKAARRSEAARRVGLQAIWKRWTADLTSALTNWTAEDGISACPIKVKMSVGRILAACQVQATTQSVTKAQLRHCRADIQGRAFALRRETQREKHELALKKLEQRLPLFHRTRAREYEASVRVPGEGAALPRTDANGHLHQDAGAAMKALHSTIAPRHQKPSAPLPEHARAAAANPEAPFRRMLQKGLATTVEEARRLVGDDFSKVQSQPFTLDEFDAALRKTQTSGCHKDDAKAQIYRFAPLWFRATLLALLNAVRREKPETIEACNEYSLMTLRKAYGRDEVRCIQLQPVFSKLLSSLLQKRLTRIIDEFGLLSRTQWGFRRGVSTKHCITVIMQALEMALCDPAPVPGDGEPPPSEEEKEQRRADLFGISAFLIRIDISKAYPSVPFARLRESWQRLGMPPNLIQLLEGLYAAPWSTSLHYNDLESDPLDADLGLPQGDALSCLMWAMFIDPLLVALTEADWTNVGGWGVPRSAFDPALQINHGFYVDDSGIVGLGIRNTQQLLDVLGDFCADNQLTLKLKAGSMESLLLSTTAEGVGQVFSIRLFDRTTNKVITKSLVAQPLHHLPKEAFLGSKKTVGRATPPPVARHIKLAQLSGAFGTRNCVPAEIKHFVNSRLVPQTCKDAMRQMPAQDSKAFDTMDSAICDVVREALGMSNKETLPHHTAFGRVAEGGVGILQPSAELIADGVSSALGLLNGASSVSFAVRSGVNKRARFPGSAEIRTPGTAKAARAARTRSRCIDAERLVITLESRCDMTLIEDSRELPLRPPPEVRPGDVDEVPESGQARRALNLRSYLGLLGLQHLDLVKVLDLESEMQAAGGAPLHYRVFTDGGYYSNSNTTGIGVAIFSPSQWDRLVYELQQSKADVRQPEAQVDEADHPVRLLRARLLRYPELFCRVLLPIVTERIFGAQSSHRPEMHGLCLSKALLVLAVQQLAGAGHHPRLRWTTYGDNKSANAKGSHAEGDRPVLHALKEADHDLGLLAAQFTSWAREAPWVDDCSEWVKSHQDDASVQPDPLKWTGPALGNMLADHLASGTCRLLPEDKALLRACCRHRLRQTAMQGAVTRRRRAQTALPAMLTCTVVRSDASLVDSYSREERSARHQPVLVADTARSHSESPLWALLQLPRFQVLHRGSTHALERRIQRLWHCVEADNAPSLDALVTMMVSSQTFNAQLRTRAWHEDWWFSPWRYALITTDTLRLCVHNPRHDVRDRLRARNRRLTSRRSALDLVRHSSHMSSASARDTDSFAFRCARSLLFAPARQVDSAFHLPRRLMSVRELHANAKWMSPRAYNTYLRRARQVTVEQGLQLQLEREEWKVSIAALRDRIAACPCPTCLAGTAPRLSTRHMDSCPQLAAKRRARCRAVEAVLALTAEAKDIASPADLAQRCGRGPLPPAAALALGTTTEPPYGTIVEGIYDPRSLSTTWPTIIPDSSRTGLVTKVVSADAPAALRLCSGSLPRKGDVLRAIDDRCLDGIPVEEVMDQLLAARSQQQLRLHFLRWDEGVKTAARLPTANDGVVCRDFPYLRALRWQGTPPPTWRLGKHSPAWDAGAATVVPATLARALAESESSIADTLQAATDDGTLHGKQQSLVRRIHRNDNLYLRRLTWTLSYCSWELYLASRLQYLKFSLNLIELWIKRRPDLARLPDAYRSIRRRLDSRQLLHWPLDLPAAPLCAARYPHPRLAAPTVVAAQVSACDTLLFPWSDVRTRAEGMVGHTAAQAQAARVRARMATRARSAPIPKPFPATHPQVLHCARLAGLATAATPPPGAPPPAAVRSTAEAQRTTAARSAAAARSEAEDRRADEDQHAAEEDWRAAEERWQEAATRDVLLRRRAEAERRRGATSSGGEVSGGGEGSGGAQETRDGEV